MSFRSGRQGSELARVCVHDLSRRFWKEGRRPRRTWSTSARHRRAGASTGHPDDRHGGGPSTLPTRAWRTYLKPNTSPMSCSTSRPDHVAGIRVPSRPRRTVVSAERQHDLEASGRTVVAGHASLGSPRGRSNHCLHHDITLHPSCQCRLRIDRTHRRNLDRRAHAISVPPHPSRTRNSTGLLGIHLWAQRGAKALSSWRARQDRQTRPRRAP
jgi:hypothetical protein